ncbi:protein-tyrosine phosphatase [[Clostridium] polysaccharolyticum]|uniref:Protein-tyrosine phosphatase n=2 Tax=[Clostridium] polysaccharolyticum TaxID=29364 RepID=A0A1I0BQ50_9FIRM|nr:protein-tyrosine phosphatase [[Clostridium] polysaccharolyticum]
MWWMSQVGKGVIKMKYSKVVFVCTGNTSRSPMAEAIYRGMSEDGTIEACSRGLVVLFPEPSNQKADMVVENHNLSLDNHVSAPLTKEDIEGNVLVLCMTFSQKIKVAEEFGITENLFTIKEYVGEEGDVIDPYGGTVLEYEECFSELSRLIKKSLIKLNEEAKE